MGYCSTRLQSKFRLKRLDSRKKHSDVEEWFIGVSKVSVLISVASLPLPSCLLGYRPKLEQTYVILTSNCGSSMTNSRWQAHTCWQAPSLDFLPVRLFHREDNNLADWIAGLLTGWIDSFLAGWVFGFLPNDWDLVGREEFISWQDAKSESWNWEVREFCLVGVKGSLRQPGFSPSGLQVEREKDKTHITGEEERNTERSLSHLIVDIKHSLLDLLIDLLGCVDECLW